MECFNLEICNFCSAHSNSVKPTCPYLNNEKPNEPSIMQNVMNYLGFGKKDESLPKQEILLNYKEKAEILCRKCNKVV